MENRISFVLGATDHAPMIFSRLDSYFVGGQMVGVGAQLMEKGAFDPKEIEILKNLLLIRRKHYGDGVFVVDCGANVGVHTVEFGKLMRDWGEVLSIEAQERIYYALAGNIALNNLFNVRAIHAAVGNQSGMMAFPEPNYKKSGTFGSLELQKKDNNEYIGQEIDYGKKTSKVPLITIDQLSLKRCDFIKLDIEGMEIEAMEGALQTISTHRPALLIEVVKSDNEAIANKLKEMGYIFVPFWLNFIAFHAEDKCLEDLNVQEGV